MLAFNDEAANITKGNFSHIIEHAEINVYSLRVKPRLLYDLIQMDYHPKMREQ